MDEVGDILMGLHICREDFVMVSWMLVKLALSLKRAQQLENNTEADDDYGAIGQQRGGLPIVSSWVAARASTFYGWSAAVECGVGKRKHCKSKI